MTSVLRTLISSLSIFLVTTSAFSATAPIVGRTVSPQDATTGTLLVQPSPEGPHGPIPLLGTDVAISVTGMISRTTVVQHFMNSSELWLEGIYVFPLPEMAAVDTLRMKIGERIIIGKIEKRAEARHAYEKAKKSGRKATLLEQERPNIFTASVANIGPGETIKIMIEYQQELRYVDGIFSLRFPMVVGPRYIPGAKTLEGFSGSGWGNPTNQVADAARITPPVLPPDTGPVNPVRIKARIDAGFPSRIESPSHQITVTNRETVAEVELTAGVVPADSDFVLSWQPTLGDAPSAALFSDVFMDETYALIMLMPPTPAVSAIEQLSREAIFVIDTSGSMSGNSIVQAKEALRMALNRLSPADSFNVIQFNTYANALFRTSRQATRKNINDAIRYVSQLKSDGGTEMISALELALGGSTVDYNRVRQVFFITDGSVGNESVLFSYIKKNLGRSRLFTVGIGSAPNSYFMRKAAEFGRGTFTYIGYAHEVKEKMTALFAKLESPVVTGIEFDWNGTYAEHWPKQLPDLYLDDPIVVVAKLSNLYGQVRVSGQRGTTPWQLDFALKGGRSESGIDRLFARRKIASLTASIAGGADSRRVRQQIIDLGISHHLVTRHTSLVAIEKMVSRPEGTAVESSALPTNLPKGWLYEGVFGEREQPLLENRNTNTRAYFMKKKYELAMKSRVQEEQAQYKRNIHKPIASLKSLETERKEMMKADRTARLIRQESELKIGTPELSESHALQADTADITKGKKDVRLNQATESAVKTPQTKPTSDTPRRYTTAQPTVVAKLQEMAGVLPQTATPAQLLLLVGLVLLLIATFIRMRRANV